MNSKKEKIIKPIAFLFILVIALPLVGIIINALTNDQLITNSPRTYLTTWITISSAITFALYLKRSSYKQANNFILAFSAAIFALIYLLTGNKNLEALPSLDLLTTEKGIYFLRVIVFVSITNSLIANVFITFFEFVTEWLTEERNKK
ncbi:hypothetical protein [Serratia nevei]|uniref:hypothetical protein n=1 Tax=Serratia nevei TaxID=2703794 RepID=UPI0012834317|nr:hypothetical protein [Salmonella enterica]EDV6136292.1 hypothetical protein [Salmonella enterica subsp. enterica]QVA24658.1 hypothetical protein JYM84_04715 [Salmonella enterica subsp. enterica serovar Rubislaw]EBE1054598.1 hypothetical protein [Salmonella enterica]EEG1308963.1 hypothetical protein [Salmonella enterica]